MSYMTVRHGAGYCHDRQYMVRPDTDIPHTLHGLAKDLGDISGMDLDEVYSEVVRRGAEDFASYLLRNGELDPEDRDRLRDLNLEIRER